MYETKIAAFKAIGFTDKEIDAIVAEADARMKSADAQKVRFKARHEVSADALDDYFTAIERPAWALYEKEDDQGALMLAIAQKAFVERYSAALAQAQKAAKPLRDPFAAMVRGERYD